ncbi:hypothetical protein B7463_g3789, partial [Scytalidium lignicola]
MITAVYMQFAELPQLARSPALLVVLSPPWLSNPRGQTAPETRDQRPEAAWERGKVQPKSTSGLLFVPSPPVEPHLDLQALGLSLREWACLFSGGNPKYARLQQNQDPVVDGVQCSRERVRLSSVSDATTAQSGT